MNKLIKYGAIIGTLGTLLVVLSLHSIWRWIQEMDQSAEDISDWWDDTFGDYEWDDDWVDGGWSEHYDPA